MKRIASLIITVVLVATILCTAAFAAGAGIVYAGNATANPGDTITIAVCISGNPGFDAAGLTVTADYPLTVVGVSAGEMMPGGFANGNKVNHSSTSLVEGDGVMCYVTVQVAADVTDFKSYPVNVTGYVTDTDVSVASISGGTVSVVCPHSAGTETVKGYAATCTENGLTDGQKCISCGATVVAQTPISALGHKTKVIPGKAATCTENGITDGEVCERCDYEKAGTVIPSPGHKEVTVDGKAATCTEKGLTDGKKCSVCGIVTVEQKEIPELGHKEVGIDGKAATCTEKGLTAGKKCSVCGVVTVEQKEIPELGHKEETIQGKAATCTEKGLTDGKKCTVCGVTTVEQKEIDATGHAWELTKSEPGADCKTTGKDTYVCKNDASHVDIRDNDKIGPHGEEIYASNGNGTHTVYCKECDKVLIDKEDCVDEDKDYVCDLCNDELPVPSDPTTKPTDPNKDDVPKTGDITPYPVYFLVAMMAVAAAAYGLKRKFDI